jgi:Asp-tRNA(Asn)/Glu-tRNA(Gln) amidotransferase B subunit
MNKNIQPGDHLSILPPHGPAGILKHQVASVVDGQKSAFHGKTYLYPTPSHGLQPIGVTQGLGSDCWIVAYITPSGARRKIRTNRLLVRADATKLQQELDAWATAHCLAEVAQ